MNCVNNSIFISYAVTINIKIPNIFDFNRFYLKKINLLSLLFIASFLLCGSVSAQTTQFIINSVTELTNAGKFEEAQVILERYHRQHPKEFQITILYGQVAYQNRNYGTFMDLYAEAIELQPKNYQLKLEFGKMLFDVNEYDAALIQLEEYLTHDPNNIDALMDKGKILKVNEDYIEASTAISKVITKDPTNAEARQLYADLLVLKSKWASLTANYTNTSQPIEALAPVLEGGIYFSPLSSPKVRIFPTLYQKTVGDNINIYQLQVENRSYLKDFGVGVDYAAGLIMYPGTTFDVTAKVKFDKYAERYILMTLSGERRPYFNSLPAIDSTIIIHTAAGSLSLLTKESWNGKATMESNFFDGVDNIITTLDAYLYSPRLRVKDFDFKLGYGVVFASSKLDKFVSDKTPAQILNSGTSAPFYTGDYYPYYTPKNLFSQSVLAFAGYNPTNVTRASLEVRYGFTGDAEKPYYFRETNPIGDVYVSKSYSKEQFNPVDVKFAISSLITPKITIHLDFNYSKNFFYITRALAMGVKVNFWR